MKIKAIAQIKYEFLINFLPYVNTNRTYKKKINWNVKKLKKTGFTFLKKI